MRITLLVAVGAVACTPLFAKDFGWVQTRGAAPLKSAVSGLPNQLETVNGQTLRERVRISAGGRQVRVRFSNEFGTRPIRIGAASVALSSTGSAVAPASLRPLTFGGASGIVIPPGAPALSDAVDLILPPRSELTISLFIPDKTSVETVHYTYFAPGDNYVSQEGDFTRQENMPIVTTTMVRAFLTGIDVLPVKATKVVVAIGDSITDGGGNIRWPDRLAERVNAAQKTVGPISIVNAGIGGNYLLHNLSDVCALARFDRDVLAAPGVTHVILLEGTNDIIEPGAKDHEFPDSDAAATAEDIIAADKQLIARAHVRGLRIYGGTILPFEGEKTAHGGYYSPAKEKIRESVNRWIRTSGAFDAVIDFDKAMRNPEAPTKLLTEYDSGDDLHPGAAGYKAMADAVDLKLLK